MKPMENPKWSQAARARSSRGAWGSGSSGASGASGAGASRVQESGGASARAAPGQATNEARNAGLARSTKAESTGRGVEEVGVSSMALSLSRTRASAAPARAAKRATRADHPMSPGDPVSGAEARSPGRGAQRASRDSRAGA